MYSLESENLSGLGGPMGSERTSINWVKYFNDLKKAKAFAEKDYGNPIKWERSDGRITSGDLRYVMYNIRKIKVEDSE